MSNMIDNFMSRLSGGDTPSDAVSEGRCIKEPLGCGRPAAEAGRPFRTALEQREWEITGFCPECQERIAAEAVS